MDLKIVYGSDAVFRNAEHGRGYESLDVLNSWREAEVSNADQLKGITQTPAELMGIKRGQLTSGYAADIVAMPDNPLEDTNALYHIDFVMQNGVVKKHGH